MFYIDAHCDTLSKILDEEKSLETNDLQFSLNKVKDIGGGIQTLACFIDSKYTNTVNSGFIRCNNIINKLKEYEKINKCNILIKNKEELLKTIKNNETKVILSIENGSAISGKLKNVEYFYNQGVRIMSISWNNDNDLGCGANTNNDVGLTQLGKKYIKELNKFGIIADISHCSEKSFWDAYLISDKPIVATHSNVYELCKHPRNLKDEQIKAIAKSGGVIGICFYSKFLNSNNRANVNDVVKHMKYIKDLVGIEYIGLGSDFDGMKVEETAIGVEDVSMIKNIMDELKNQCFSDEDIVKIMWKNWYNLLKKYLK